VIPPEIDKAAAAGSPTPSGLSAEEKRAYETLAFTCRTVGGEHETAAELDSRRRLIDATARLLTGRDGCDGTVTMGLELASQRHPLVLVVRIVCGETPSPDLELS
jgi:hypothetical protein